MSEILKILEKHKDEKYGDFTAKLIPTLPKPGFLQML